MTKLRVKLRKEREDVHPTKVLVIEITLCRLDPAVYRRTAVARNPFAGRGLDLDRRHRNHRRFDSADFLVATAPRRIVVRGGTR